MHSKPAALKGAQRQLKVRRHLWTVDIATCAESSQWKYHTWSADEVACHAYGEGVGQSSYLGQTRTWDRQHSCGACNHCMDTHRASFRTCEAWSHTLDHRAPREHMDYAPCLAVQHVRDQVHLPWTMPPVPLLAGIVSTDQKRTKEFESAGRQRNYPHEKSALG